MSKTVLNPNYNDGLRVSGHPLPDPEEDPVHDWMIATQDHYASHPVNVVETLRKHVEDLPKTAATWEIPNAFEGTDYTVSCVRPEMVWMVGSWKTDARQNKKKWVNPNHPHRSRYSDVLVQCECGTLMSRVRDQANTTKHDSDNDHTDDCKLQWKHRAKARLCENRAQRLREAVKTGNSARSMDDRFGVTDSVSTVAQAVGVNLTELRQDYLQRRANTLAYLLTKFDPHKLAYVYGVSYETVRRDIRERTPYEMADLSTARKEGI